MNKAILIGRLGADPTLHTTASGQSVCHFSVATTERWSSNGESKERTEWHRVIVWGRQAENAAKYLQKGRQVCIEGRIQTREWQDRDGSKRYTVEIVASSLEYLGSKPQGAPKQADEPPTPEDGVW